MENTHVILHGFFETCKKISLQELYQLILKKEVTTDERAFYIAIYNYFLQVEQKKLIGESYGKEI